MSALTNEQKECLTRFRPAVADILKPFHDDSYLLRWLKARNFDLKQSEKMLRDHMKWRELVKADEILANWNPPPVLLEYYPGGLFSRDKEGRAVWIEPLGRADVKGLMSSASKSDLIRYKIGHCEKIQNILHVQNSDKDIGGLVIIFDLEHFGMKHLWKPALDFYTEILSIYEANYPETLEKTFVINAPRIFPLAYSLVKPFLSEATKRKIHILGSNWKEHLLRYIDEDQLPVHWGGTCTDPDGNPYCKSKISIGGEVDKSCYIPGYSCVDRNLMTKLSISRKASHDVPFQIDSSGSTLRWQFMTENHDIGFGVVYKTSAEVHVKEEIVVPVARLNSHIVPETGSLSCSKPGLYVVRFDNTHSWSRSKKLFYQIDVLPPAESVELDADFRKSNNSLSVERSPKTNGNSR